MWIRVTLPHAVYAIRVEVGVVVEAPPIAKWMTGRGERYVADWLRKKGATFEKLA